MSLFAQVLKNLLRRQWCVQAAEALKDEVSEEAAVLVGSESPTRPNIAVTFVPSVADPTLPIT